MAIHENTQSMLFESLPEMFLVAEYCVNFEKDQNIWPAPGCYGYPAVLLLCSIADAIGSYVIGGNIEKHFDILNHQDYYDLGLDKKDIKLIYNSYRNLVSHNAVLAPGTMLDIGTATELVFEMRGGTPLINLQPFLDKTRIVLGKFLANSEEIITNSKQLQDIIKKSHPIDSSIMSSIKSGTVSTSGCGAEPPA